MINEIFKNMLQLMRFSVYLEGILKTNYGYYDIEVMISAAHMLGAIRGQVPTRNFKKNGAIWYV